MTKFLKLLVAVFLSLILCMICAIPIQTSIAVMACTIGMTLISSYAIDRITNKSKLKWYDWVEYTLGFIITILATVAFNLRSLGTLIAAIVVAIIYVIFEAIEAK